MIRFALYLGLAFAAAAAGAGEDPESAEAVSLARAALGQQLGRAQEDVVADGAAFVQFPDTSLGCPHPDETAAPVVTPGWRIALRVGEDRYEVRVAASGAAVRVCGKLGAKARPSPAVLADVRAAGVAADAARLHLATRLSVPAAQVQRVWARPVRWPAGLAGCGSPERAEAGSGARQFLVLLEHAGVEHRYRVDGQDVVPCASQDGGGG